MTNSARALSCEPAFEGACCCLVLTTGAAFLDQNQKIWSSEATEAQAQELFRTVLRLEIGLFDSAYDDLIKRKVIDGNIPDRLPLPGGGRGSHGHSKEREWRILLGLESGRDNADEEGSRTQEI